MTDDTKTITKEELAHALNGMEYGEGQNMQNLVKAAKDNNLIIVSGASDDLCSFDGAWEDEADCYTGGEIWISRGGPKQIPDDDRRTLRRYGVFDAWMADAKRIEAVWNKTSPDGRHPSWHYRTDIPHATFDVMEDGELYCIGMVIDLDEAFPL